jgi:hypothetical protein
MKPEPTWAALLLDHLYGLTTQTDIAKQTGVSVSRVNQKLNDLVRRAGFHYSFRDPHRISQALARRDPRNRAWAYTPQAFFEDEITHGNACPTETEYRRHL